MAPMRRKFTLGVAMFKNIAPLAPAEVLQAIEMSASDSEERAFLSTENHLRWGWCGLLRSIAYDPQYFNRAALLLARFVAEETRSNNQNSGRNLFKELFHLYLSGTQALVEARLDVVRQLIESDDAAANACGLEALAAMMNSLHFTSSHDFTFGGMHRDFGWEPQTGDETSAWFKSVIAFSKAQVDSNSPHSPTIKLLFARHFRALWVHAGICTELEEVVREFAAQDGWPEGWHCICDTIYFDTKIMSSEFAERTRSLEVLLRPDSLEQKIRAYLLTGDGHSHLTGYEIDDSDTAIELAQEHLNNFVERLAEMSVQNMDAISSLLPELLSRENWLILQFGVGLGKCATDIEQTWHHLRNALNTLPENKRNISLLRGFIEAVSMKDVLLVNKLMDDALTDPILSPHFPILQCSYQVDEAGAKRLISHIESGRTHSYIYSYLKYGRVAESIPLPLLRRILLGLISLPDGYEIAIDIFWMRIFPLKSDKSKIDRDTFALGRELLKLNMFHSANQNHPYHVNEVAIVCMVGDEAYEDAIAISKSLARALVDYRTGARQFGELAKTLFQLQPAAAISVFLNDDSESKKSFFEMIKAFFKRMLGHKVDKTYIRPLSYWFDFGRDSPVNAVSPEILIAWARKNLKARLPKLAEEIHLFVKNAEHDTLILSPLAVEILELASDRSVILDIYASRFYPMGGWSGSLADILSPYLALAINLQTHNDPLLARWAKKQADLLSKRIEEERKRDRCVDESFE